MSSVYYVAPIIGSGTIDDLYRPDAPDGWTAMNVVIPCDQQTGRPLHDWCLVEIEAADHAKFAARIGWIPLQAADAGVVSRLQTRVGVDLSAAATEDDVIATVGKSLNAAFPGRRKTQQILVKDDGRVS